MRGKKAKKIRRLMPDMEPGYSKLSNGQIVSPKRIAYQKSKKNT